MTPAQPITYTRRCAEEFARLFPGESMTAVCERAATVTRQQLIDEAVATGRFCPFRVRSVFRRDDATGAVFAFDAGAGDLRAVTVFRFRKPKRAKTKMRTYTRYRGPARYLPDGGDDDAD